MTDFLSSGFFYFYRQMLRQVCISHQIFIHFFCHIAAFMNCPYHQRLSPVHIACGEYLLYIGAYFPASVATLVRAFSSTPNASAT